VNVADEHQPPAEPAPGKPRMEKRDRRTVVRVIVITQIVLAIVTAVTVAVGYRHLDKNVESIPLPDFHRPERVKVEGPKEPMNFLVLGSDSRDGKGNGIDNQQGIGERSDTTILLHVSADRKEAYGVSLPRDALVDRPACKTTDGRTIPGEHLAIFNSAFEVGGVACTIQTVEKLTNIRIDDTIVVDFNGFKDMVDAVNGVQVCLPKEVSDPKHHIYFDAGTQTLHGDQALNYVRERTVLSPTGDIGRMKRQQAFIASMINQVKSAGTLTRLDRIYKFLDAATASLKTTDGLDSLSELADLAYQLRHTGLDKIRFVTVPFEEYAPNPNRLVWKTEEANILWDRIRSDETLGARFKQDSLDASDPVGSPSPGGESDTDKAEALANGLCA
jgi:LCP family protein required for cell wall assembly